MDASGRSALRVDRASLPASGHAQGRGRAPGARGGGVLAAGASRADLERCRLAAAERAEAKPTRRSRRRRFRRWSVPDPPGLAMPAVRASRPEPRRRGPAARQRPPAVAGRVRVLLGDRPDRPTSRKPPDSRVNSPRPSSLARPSARSDHASPRRRRQAPSPSRVASASIPASPDAHCGSSPSLTRAQAISLTLSDFRESMGCSA